MNPWKTVWLQPRETIRSIAHSHPKKSLWILCSIFGFAELMNFFQSLSLGLWLNAFGILLLAAVLCPFFGYGLIAIWSWLLFHVGRWLKGSGTFDTVRAAYAWSCVPLLWTIPIWIAILILFQERLFVNTPQDPGLTTLGASILFCLLITRLGLIVWALIIYFNMLAEVHRFSVMRAIGTVIITGLIMGVATGVLWVGVIFWITGVTA